MEGKKAIGRLNYLNSIMVLTGKYFTVINDISGNRHELTLDNVQEVLNAKFYWNFPFNLLVVNHWLKGVQNK
jgi:hypothetical protein